MFDVLRDLLGELGNYREQLVFTGGLVLPLYFEQAPPYGIRATDDGDAVTVCASHADYVQFQLSLGSVGIQMAVGEGAPLCRMRTPHGHILDVIPTEPGILGFGNRWFAQGVARAETHDLGDGTSVRLFPAPLYFAAKIEAFRDRGASDPWGSHDLDDLLNLMACRPSLPTEIENESAEFRTYVAGFMGELKGIHRFEELLEGNIGERYGEVLAMMARLEST